MARKKLRVQKFFKGAQADARAGKAAMSPNTSVTGQVRSPQDPVDPGIATESITSFKDNLPARQKAMGFANVLPGAGVVNVLGAVSDTAVGRKAMGMPLISGTTQKLKEMSGRGGDENITCPPGYINVGGQCVKKASKGGAMKYYKDLL